MTETPGAKATVTFQDLKVTATKDGLWHVEAAGRSASAQFLDQALDLLLPLLSRDERDRLLIRLLTELERPRPPRRRESWSSSHRADLR
jgi:hypothetical protein